MALRQSGILSSIYCKTAGSAYKLSTGMSKKPYKRLTLEFELDKMFLTELVNTIVYIYIFLTGRNSSEHTTYSN